MSSVYRLLLLFPALVAELTAAGQCPLISVQTGDSACAASTVNVSASVNLPGTYDWDFCSGDFINPAFDTAYSDAAGLLNIVAGVRAVSDSSGDHLFVCSRDNGKLVRLDFDNGYGSAPTATADLGNLGGSISRPNCLQFIRENGTWYSLTVDVFSNTVTRSEFLNGLDSLPTSSANIITTALNLPEGVDIVRTSDDSVFALVANFQDNRVLVFSFGTSILNTPVLTDSFTVTGADGITDISVIRDCDRWFAAVTVFRTPDLILIDLGTTLSDVQPQFTAFNNGQVYPYGIRLVRDGGRIYSFNSTAVGTLNIHDLGVRLSSPSITFKGSYSVNAGTISGIDLIRKGSSWFGFASVESANILKLLDFRDTCSASAGSDTTSVSATVQYSEAGDYLVALGYTDTAGNVSHAAAPVRIHPLPATAATLSGNCLGDSTRLTDISTISDGSLSGTLWHFGDGDSSLSSHATHLYQDTGSFSLTLTSYSDRGCSRQLDTVFRIAPLPVASFVAADACSGSPVNITEQSTVATGFISFYSWMFGNGDSLSGTLPVYSYPAFGTYLIRLDVVSSDGCYGSDTQSVQIAERPSGSFSVSNTCADQQVQFIDLSGAGTSSIISRLWEFGDGDTSTAGSPSHQYPPGTGDYDVRLLVNASNGCSDTVEQTIRINDPPTVRFSVSTSSICERSDVAFSDSSFVTGDTVSAWLWDFGDGLTSVERNPVHRFDTAGTYVVTLVAYSPTSCPGSSYQLPITVLESPRAGFTASLTCLGAVTSFTDTSLLPAGAALASVTWVFGNGDSSSSSNPVMLYDTAGLYTVLQTVTTTDGCTSLDTGEVRVYAPPSAAFIFDRPCNGQPVRFTNTSFSDTWSNVQSVAWNFGDPASGTSDTSSSLQPVHIFTGSSTYSVSLIAVSDKGCRDTVQRPVTPLPTSNAVFTYAPTCYGDLMQFFNPGSPLDSLYVWQFGDNQTNFLQEPAHFYALPGNYTVTLSVIAATGCISTASRSVTVSPLPVASFSAGNSCLGSNCLLTDQSTVGNGTITTRAWSVDGIGGIGNGSTSLITFPDTGNYRIRLTVTSDIGCTDTVSTVVMNHPLPEASFSFNPQFGNPPLDVDFQNLSAGAGTYTWHFGDGDSSISADPSHTYADSGLFAIRMIATSAFGCSDTALSSIYVVRPVLDIAVTGDSSYRSGDYFHIVTRLANLGTRAIDRVWLEARLENGSVIRERLTRDIPTGVNGTTTYTFSASFLLNGNEDPEYYCIKATDPNDEEDDVPSNNERCYNRTSEPVIMVYPNPTTGILSLDLLMNYREEVDIDLYDNLGRFLENISRSRLEPGLNRVELDIRDRSAGNYSLRIGFRDKTYTRSILLEK
jgi:PKD repeat protein